MSAEWVALHESLRAGRIGGNNFVVEEMFGVDLAVSVSLATRASRLMSGGVIPASTGKNVVSVGRMHPEMTRIESFSATSSFLVWVLRHQTGEAYSAAL